MSNEDSIERSKTVSLRGGTNSLLTCAFLLFAPTAQAQIHSIHVEWGYTPPTEPAVTGFRLYQEGASVYTVNSGNSADPAHATSLDTTVNLRAAVTKFTLTATFSDSTESPHSAPFAYAPASGIDTRSAPVINDISNVPRYLSPFCVASTEVTEFNFHATLDTLLIKPRLPQAVPISPDGKIMVASLNKEGFLQARM